jgi:hypothetical protein
MAVAAVTCPERIGDAPQGCPGPGAHDIGYRSGGHCTCEPFHQNTATETATPDASRCMHVIPKMFGYSLGQFAVSSRNAVSAQMVRSPCFWIPRASFHSRSPGIRDGIVSTGGRPLAWVPCRGMPPFGKCSGPAFTLGNTCTDRQGWPLRRCVNIAKESNPSPRSALRAMAACLMASAYFPLGVVTERCRP